VISTAVAKTKSRAACVFALAITWQAFPPRGRGGFRRMNASRNGAHWLFGGACAWLSLAPRYLMSLAQNLFWNLNGWDSISTSAGEVINPTVTIPRALWITIPLVVVLLFLPLLAAAGVNKPVPWADWESGQFTVIAQYVCAGWVGCILPRRSGAWSCCGHARISFFFDGRDTLVPGGGARPRRTHECGVCMRARVRVCGSS
jgi:hypothetical protein